MRVTDTHPAAFRMKLDPSYTFEFIDAPFPSTPAPGIDALFTQTRNFTWWPSTTPSHIRAAHRWLDEYLATHGPFDALCGFSQGCSLIGSYLLYRAVASRQRRHLDDSSDDGISPPPPDSPLPFRAAIFICGGLPLVSLEDLGLPVSAEAWAINDATGKALVAKARRLKELASDLSSIRPGMSLWDDTRDLVHDVGAKPGIVLEQLLGPSDLGDDVSPAARISRGRPLQSDEAVSDSDSGSETPDVLFGLDFSAFPRDLRIDIPTVHVVGGKDPKFPAGAQLARFCSHRAVFDHGGGHDIPRTSHVSLRIAELVRAVMEEAEARTAMA